MGLIPTGWYPNSVSFNADGAWAYVVNGKSPTGANPDFYYSYGPPAHKNGYASNVYNPQCVKAGLQLPRPRPGAARADDAGREPTTASRIRRAPPLPSWPRSGQV